LFVQPIVNLPSRRFVNMRVAEKSVVPRIRQRSLATVGSERAPIMLSTEAR
jgi:hypothetical protein